MCVCVSVLTYNAGPECYAQQSEDVEILMGITYVCEGSDAAVKVARSSALTLALKFPNTPCISSFSPFIFMTTIHSLTNTLSSAAPLSPRHIQRNECLQRMCGRQPFSHIPGISPPLSLPLRRSLSYLSLSLSFSSGPWLLLINHAALVLSTVYPSPCLLPMAISKVSDPLLSHSFHLSSPLPL